MDEMTGIQVLAPPYPDKTVMPGKTPRMKFEDIRHGRNISLTGSLMSPRDVRKSGI